MLPRSLLTHRSHYVAYEAAQRHKPFRDVVDDLLCDDIAFNFVVANATGMARRQNLVAPAFANC